MTPTAVLLVTAAASVLLFVPGQGALPIPATALIAAYLAVESPRHAWRAAKVAAFAVAPLAIYLLLVWGVVAQEMLPTNTLVANGTRSAALFVFAVCVRLFLVVLLLRATLFPVLSESPLAFVRDLWLPATGKAALMMTMSIASTIRASAEKSWVSLVAANVLTRGMSLKNLRNMPVLVLTVWMFTVGALSTRLQHKWAAEDMRLRLARALDGHSRRGLSRRDAAWLAAVLVTAASSLAGSWRD